MAWIYDHNRRVTKQKVEVPQTLKRANASHIHTSLHWLNGTKCLILLLEKNAVFLIKSHSISH